VDAAVMGENIGRALRTGFIQGGIMVGAMLVGMGVGSVVTAGLAEAGLGAGAAQFGGTVAGAFASGFAEAAIQAQLAGGNAWAAGLRAGATSAAFAAALYGGQQLWQSLNSSSPAIGGTQSCDICQPPGFAPSGNVPAYCYNDLFEGGARVTSRYGWRYIAGSGWEIHSGFDVQPLSGGYGTTVLAPGRITIGYGEYLLGYGDTLRYLPEGSKIEVFHAHTKLLPGLEPGMVVNKGTPIGTITQTGRTFGPHSHIEIRQDGILHDPSTIFK
jgi:murein DD-endopeptidase MepM/ murein hydrolase activator NlpD